MDMWKDNVKINGTNTATKFVGPATKIVGTQTNPTGANSYYMPFYSATEETGNKSLMHNNGLRYNVRGGTTDVEGYGIIYLGNNLAPGTDQNKHGRLRLYCRNTGRADLRYAESTNDVTVYLPTHTGNLQSCTVLYSNGTGTNGTVTLSETSANFTYLDIYYYKSESDMGGNIYEHIRVLNPNGRIVPLANTHVATNTIMQVLTKLVLISGTSITVKKEMLANFTVNTTSVSECTTPSTSQTFIVRVDGWK